MLAGISAHEYSDCDPGPRRLTIASTSVGYIVVILPYCHTAPGELLVCSIEIMVMLKPHLARAQMLVQGQGKERVKERFKKNTSRLMELRML